MWWILRVAVLAVLVSPGETIRKRLIFGSARGIGLTYGENYIVFQKSWQRFLLQRSQD